VLIESLLLLFCFPCYPNFTLSHGWQLLTVSGHRVIIACRTQAKVDAAAAKCMAYAATNGDFFNPSRNSGGEADGAERNLALLSSVRAFTKSVKESKLDTLVFNAGLAHGQADKEPFRTMDGFEETVGVNHLGHFLLADLIAPILVKSNSAPRIVSTASPVHYLVSIPFGILVLCFFSDLTI